MSEPRDVVTVDADDLKALLHLIREAHRLVLGMTGTPLGRAIGGEERLAPEFGLRPAQGILLAAMKRVTTMMEDAGGTMRRE